MKFKVVCKRLIYIDEGYNLIKGENNNELITIEMPRYPKGTGMDYMSLSHRLTVTSIENSEIAVVAILTKEELSSNKICLTCPVTAEITSVGKTAFFKVTSVGSNDFIDITECSMPININNNTDEDRFPAGNDLQQILSIFQHTAQEAKDIALEAKDIAQTAKNAALLADESAQNAQDFSRTAEENAIKSDNAAQKAANSVNEFNKYIAYPNNYLIYDDMYKPSVMVAIPKFYLDEVIDGASHTVHPAFIINGVEQDVIYISKYQNIVENERAYSLPMKPPQTNMTFDQAWNYCKNKGAGWHLMTNAEWAAIALWCKKNGTMPKGNNNFGKDVSEKLQKAIHVSYENDGKINKVLTGSGNVDWYHDRTFAGIADLNGNVWEWCSGFCIVDGEFQILANNDAADFNNSISANSILWKTILQNGTLSEPKAANALKYIDSTETAFSKIKSNAETNSVGANLAMSLAIIPEFGASDSDYGNAGIWLHLNGERIPLRGNCFNGGSRSGIFSVLINSRRTGFFPNVGFRCAYYGKI